MRLIIDMLTTTLGPFGPVIAIGMLGVFLILGTVLLMINQRADPLDKLKKNARPDTGKSKDKQQSLRSRGRNEKLDKYANFLEPQDEEQLSEMKRTLMQAGYRGRDAVRYFHFAQFALGIGFLVIGVVYYVMFVSGTDTTTQQTLMYILGPGGVGYMLPKYWITKRQQKRQEEIEEGFPDSLDMMLICVEAGQSLDQAIIRVAHEIKPSFPALSEEYEIVSQQIKAGRDKPSVLNEMS